MPGPPLGSGGHTSPWEGLFIRQREQLWAGSTRELRPPCLRGKPSLQVTPVGWRGAPRRQIYNKQPSLIAPQIFAQK